LVNDFADSGAYFAAVDEPNSDLRGAQIIGLIALDTTAFIAGVFVDTEFGGDDELSDLTGAAVTGLIALATTAFIAGVLCFEETEFDGDDELSDFTGAAVTGLIALATYAFISGELLFDDVLDVTEDAGSEALLFADIVFAGEEANVDFAGISVVGTIALATSAFIAGALVFADSVGGVITFATTAFILTVVSRGELEGLGSLAASLFCAPVVDLAPDFPPDKESVDEGKSVAEVIVFDRGDKGFLFAVLTVLTGGEVFNASSVLAF
jgi:hypothetical protein